MNDLRILNELLDSSHDLDESYKCAIRKLNGFYLLIKERFSSHTEALPSNLESQTNLNSTLLQNNILSNEMVYPSLIIAY